MQAENVIHDHEINDAEFMRVYQLQLKNQKKDTFLIIGCLLIPANIFAFAFLLFHFNDYQAFNLTLQYSAFYIIPAILYMLITHEPRYLRPLSKAESAAFFQQHPNLARYLQIIPPPHNGTISQLEKDSLLAINLQK